MSTTFQQHEHSEVATSLTDSKQIAHGRAEANRYQNRMSALLIGNADVRPYDAVYMDNMPMGLTGYWTVLSVTHIIGAEATELAKGAYPDLDLADPTLYFDGLPYVLRVELGCDKLGQTSKAPAKRATRNVDAELSSNVKVDPAHSTLVTPPTFPGLSKPNTHGETLATAATTNPTVAAPDFSRVSQLQRWEATNG